MSYSLRFMLVLMLTCTYINPSLNELFNSPVRISIRQTPFITTWLADVEVVIMVMTLWLLHLQMLIWLEILWSRFLLWFWMLKLRRERLRLCVHVFAVHSWLVPTVWSSLLVLGLSWIWFTTFKIILLMMMLLLFVRWLWITSIVMVMIYSLAILFIMFVFCIFMLFHTFAQLIIQYIKCLLQMADVNVWLVEDFFDESFEIPKLFRLMCTFNLIEFVPVYENGLLELLSIV